MGIVYRTRFVFHIKSIRYVLIGFSASSLVFYFILLSQGNKFNLAAFIFGVLPIFLILIAPVLYLHLTYYIKNFGLKIEIDESQDSLTVVKFGKHISYSLSSIMSVEQHLGLYYRNRIDRMGRRIVPWTPYGYLNVRLDNGSQLQLTSLMIDIQKPPFDTTHTYFRFFPYLKKGAEISEKTKILEVAFENEISFYKSNFKLHTKEQLTEKLRNEKTYQKAAVEAARQLLKSKFSTHSLK